MCAYARVTDAAAAKPRAAFPSTPAAAAGVGGRSAPSPPSFARPPWARPPARPLEQVLSGVGWSIPLRQVAEGLGRAAAKCGVGRGTTSSAAEG